MGRVRRITTSVPIRNPDARLRLVERDLSELVEKQAEQGGWMDYQAGPAYSTAMGLIILQMPKRYLPIFQK